MVLLILITGCHSIPQEAYSQPNANCIIDDAFIVMMEKGLTTREQEQAMLRANRRAWHAQDYALNNAPLPPDMQQPGNTGPLDQNVLQALDIDLQIRKAQQDLRNSFDKGGISPINTQTHK